MGTPVIAIVGRPNVGKSTLFNRIVGRRISIVEDRPGITRDRIYAASEWTGRDFRVIDTGGLDFGESDPIVERIRAQVELAIDEADAILLVVDVVEGATPADEEIADALRRSGKPVVVAANKSDNTSRTVHSYDFYRLGFPEVIPVSAVHGLGIGDLLDAVLALVDPSENGEGYSEDTIKTAVIGRPNVGKSSLVNAILGEDRVLVSEAPGTTRDAVDTPFSLDGQDYVLIDTAGMRKRGKVYESTERYSVLRALRAIERCDVAVLVLDATQGVTEQDKRIAGLALAAGRAAVIAVNKWDAIEKDGKTAQEFEKIIRSHFLFMPWAPVAFVSAKTGQRVRRVLEMASEAAESHSMRIGTSTVNTVVHEATGLVPPPASKGRRLKVLYATQVSVRPPTFAVFVNDPELMHFSYERYLENQLREAFGFSGTPVRLEVRARS